MKRLISALLAIFTVAALICVPVTAEENTDNVIVADTSWYNGEDDIFFIEDAADFLGLAEIYADFGETFAGKTVELTADINLNPGWGSAVSVKATTKAVTLPEAPANVFAGIPEFRGTFDGNGYTVKGMYVASENITGPFGFIHLGAGNCVVKNVVFTNSLVYASTATNNNSNWGMGGIMGTYRDGTGTLLISNVYTDINVVNMRQDTLAKTMIGGILGRLETVKAPNIKVNQNNTTNDIDGDGTFEPIYTVESANANLKNCVYAGMIVTMNAQQVAGNKVLNVSQLVAGTNSQGFATTTGLAESTPHENNVNYMWDCVTNSVAMGNTTYAATSTGANENYGEGKIDFYNVIEGKKSQDSLINVNLFKVSTYNNPTHSPAAFYYADTADFVYSNVANAIVPSTVAAMLNHNAWAQVGKLGGKNALRILTGIEHLDWAEIGYVVTVGEKNETYVATTVYKSITALGQPVTAGQLDGNYEYLYGLVIKNIPDNCTLTVTPTVTTSKGTAVELHSYTVEIVDGDLVISTNLDWEDSFNADDAAWDFDSKFGA